MLIGLQNATFEFGSRIIFEEATWHIGENERIGLVGYNGTGKSTLFKILMGEYSLSKGTVEKSKETTIGYIHQELMHLTYDMPILEMVLSAFEEVQMVEKRQKELEILIADNPENEKVLWEYSEILEKLQSLDAYNLHYKAEEVLMGLGFKETDFGRIFNEFSGGWRMRVILAKMILQQPKVLLLDEPTNHLDLPSIEWLERYLQNYNGSVVIISHDKFFLNKMVTKIVEIYQQKLHFYHGDYSFFQTEKQVRIELMQKAFLNQQDYIRQQERFIERFKAKASKAAQAQSIQKRLDKINVLEDVELEKPNLKINFSLETIPGKILYELKNITKKYQTTIFDAAEAQIIRGDKIALIGANGVGKSTILRIIGDIEEFGGQCLKGHNVSLSFYAQHQVDSLHLEWTILEELHHCGSKKNDLEIRAILGCFLFSNDDVDKKIKVLSGGEKARVALAKVMISESNFLLLDEPTNHLDMHSVDILAQALRGYQGSYIIVSHDRYFISQTANKIWEIDQNKIKDFPGDYEEFKLFKNKQNEQKLATVEKKPAKFDKKNNKPQKTNHNNLAENEVEVEKKSILKQLTKLDNLISEQKQKIDNITLELADPKTLQNKSVFVSKEKELIQTQTELNSLQQQLDTLIERQIFLESN